MADASCQILGMAFEDPFCFLTSDIWNLNAHIAQSVEHFLGKEEVTGSSPVMGSIDFL